MVLKIIIYDSLSADFAKNYGLYISIGCFVLSFWNLLQSVLLIANKYMKGFAYVNVFISFLQLCVKSFLIYSLAMQILKNGIQSNIIPLIVIGIFLLYISHNFLFSILFLGVKKAKQLKLNDLRHIRQSQVVPALVFGTKEIDSPALSHNLNQEEMRSKSFSLQVPEENGSHQGNGPIKPSTQRASFMKNRFQANISPREQLVVTTATSPTDSKKNKGGQVRNKSYSISSNQSSQGKNNLLSPNYGNVLSIMENEDDIIDDGGDFFDYPTSNNHSNSELAQKRQRKKSSQNANNYRKSVMMNQIQARSKSQNPLDEV